MYLLYSSTKENFVKFWNSQSFLTAAVCITGIIGIALSILFSKLDSQSSAHVNKILSYDTAVVHFNTQDGLSNIIGFLSSIFGIDKNPYAYNAYTASLNANFRLGGTNTSSLSREEIKTHEDYLKNRIKNLEALYTDQRTSEISQYYNVERQKNVLFSFIIIFQGVSLIFAYRLGLLQLNISK